MFDPGFKVGDIVTNEEMREAFAVGNMEVCASQTPTIVLS